MSKKLKGKPPILRRIDGQGPFSKAEPCRGTCGNVPWRSIKEEIRKILVDRISANI
jgi:hypothetical protein